jgi:hypothetical protein
LSKVLNFESFSKTASNAKANYTFDMWIDTQTKLVHMLRFVDPADKSASFTLAQNYTGGDTYPFAISFAGKDAASGGAANGSLKFAINTKTDKDSGELTFVEGGTNGSLTFDLTPSDKVLKVVAPTGAQSIMSILDLLGLSSAAGGTTTDNTSAVTNLTMLQGL